MIEKVLEERGSRYGKFSEHAKIAQALQEVLWSHPNWRNMPTDTRQSVVVITDKIARMLNGFHDYDDNWVDIIGYATLVLNRIRDDERKQLEILESLKFQPVEPQIENDVKNYTAVATTHLFGKNLADRG